MSVPSGPQPERRQTRTAALLLVIVALILLAVLALSIALLGSHLGVSSPSSTESGSTSTAPVPGQFLLTSYNFPPAGPQAISSSS